MTSKRSTSGRRVAVPPVCLLLAVAAGSLIYCGGWEYSVRKNP